MEKINHQPRLLVPLFLIGIVSIAFCYLPFFRDPALEGRYVCLALFAFTGVLFLPKKRFSLNSTTPSRFYLAFIIISFLSALWALNPSEAVYESSKTFMGFLIFLSVGIIFNKDRNYLLLVKTIIMVNLAYLTLVLYDLYGIGFEILNDELLETIIGLNGQKNQLSIFLFLSIPFCTLGIIGLRKYQKVLAIISLVGSLVVILVLQTRSVWVGLAIAVVIFCFMNLSDIKGMLKSISRIWLITGIFFLGLAIYFLFVSSEVTMQPGTLQARMLLWKNSILILSDHPLLGIGTGNWKLIFASYGIEGHANDIENGIRMFQRPHNDFLWILSETGIFGFSLYVFFLGSILFNSIKYSSGISNKVEKKINALIFSSIVGYLTISFFTFPKERIEHIVLFNILLGVLHYQTTDYVFGFKGGKGIPVILKSITILLLSGFLVIGILRMKGDFYVQKWIKVNKPQNNELAMEMLMKAQSIFFTIDFLAWPIKWYEGLTHVSVQEFDKALVAFEDAYHLNPNCLMVLNNLASAYEMAGDRENAKLYYEKAIEISPHYDDARLNLASVLYNEGNYKESMFWFDQVSNMEKKNPYSNIISNMEGKY